jgi:hypothetical protein
MILPLLLTLVQSPAPTLDGTISPGEWDRAVHTTGSDGLEVFTLTTVYFRLKRQESLGWARSSNALRGLAGSKSPVSQLHRLSFAFA